MILVTFWSWSLLVFKFLSHIWEPTELQTKVSKCLLSIYKPEWLKGTQNSSAYVGSLSFPSDQGLLSHLFRCWSQNAKGGVNPCQFFFFYSLIFNPTSSVVSFTPICMNFSPSPSRLLKTELFPRNEAIFSCIPTFTLMLSICFIY